MRPPNPLNWLKLVLTPGLGPGGLGDLLEAFETPEEILGKSKQDLSRVPSLRTKALTELLKTQSGDRDSAALRELEEIDRLGIGIVTVRDADYPANLKRTPKPPPLFFFKGTLTKGNESSIGVVGTRSCDSYGLRMTRKISGDLAARGILIVSGLALGIDGAAHQAALNAGGETWGYLAGGFNHLYPKEHRDLADQIRENGALLTEFPLDEPPQRSNFPSRNRLIAGTSLGVFVAQAPAKSGALITARYAMEYNREVFALPGKVDDPASRGPHRLIQDGAKLVAGAEDILEELEGRMTFEVRERIRRDPPAFPLPSKPRRSAPNPDPTPPENKPPARPAFSELVESLAPEDRPLVKRLERGPLHIDLLASEVNMPVQKVSERLLQLEMKGIIQRLPGMSFDLV